MSGFDFSEFLSDFNRESEGLSPDERLAYLKGKMSGVPPEHRAHITALWDAMRGNVRNVIVLIHGIRTSGTWQSDFETVAREDIPDFDVISVKFGYFDVFRFLVPLARRWPIARATRELRSARGKSGDGKISVIAHSFGTYVMSRVLAKEPDIRLDRLITCGAIIKQSFRWDRLPGNLKKEVVNDVGCRDFLPVLAKSATLGYGASGFLGFGSALAKDRYHDFGHSDFFCPDFMREYWIPLLAENQYNASAYKRTKPHWFLTLLSSFNLSGWVFLTAVFLFVYLCYRLLAFWLW